MRAEQHIGDMRQKELALRISTLEACDPDKLFCDEIQALVQEAISELPPTSREVFILSRMKNLPNKEIALRLDISVKTVEFTSGGKIRNGIDCYSPHDKSEVPSTIALDEIEIY